MTKSRPRLPTTSGAALCGLALMLAGAARSVYAEEREAHARFESTCAVIDGTGVELVTFDVRDMPLGRLLDRLGARVEATNGRPEALEPNVTMTVDNLPLGEALARILRGQSFMLQTLMGPAGDCGGARHKLWVFSSGVTAVLPGAIDNAAALGAKLRDVDAASALATSEPRAASRALEALAIGDADARVRQDALYAMAEVDAIDNLAPLETALADPDAFVRATAVVALADLRDERAIPALAVALTDSEARVREEAVHALAGLGGELVLPLLQQASRDQDPDVSEVAREALLDMARVD